MCLCCWFCHQIIFIDDLNHIVSVSLYIFIFIRNDRYTNKPTCVNVYYCISYRTLSFEFRVNIISTFPCWSLALSQLIDLYTTWISIYLLYIYITYTNCRTKTCWNDVVSVRSFPFFRNIHFIISFVCFSVYRLMDDGLSLCHKLAKCQIRVAVECRPPLRSCQAAASQCCVYIYIYFGWPSKLCGLHTVYLRNGNQLSHYHSSCPHVLIISFQLPPP